MKAEITMNKMAKVCDKNTRCGWGGGKPAFVEGEILDCLSDKGRQIARDKMCIW